MDFFKFFKSWLATLIIVFMTMIIITISMKIVFKQKDVLPEAVVGKITENAAVDALEIALHYKDGVYKVDTGPNKWQIDIT